MVKFLNRSWRNDLAEVAASASHSILIAAPFIKYKEAVWFCEQVRSGVEITTLSNINPEAIGASVLDLSALRHLSEASPSAKLIALPSLHAKVFIADDRAAIVTSGNLTRSALDNNLEYGALFYESDLIQEVRKDMRSFEQLGSLVDKSTLSKLEPLEIDLRAARANIANSAHPTAKKKFNNIMKRARPTFAAAQVGNRSAHAVFGDAIQFILSRGPQTTKVLQEQIRKLMPDLCNDSESFYIKGERYGIAWKRRSRHAQLYLKRKGIIIYSADTKTWALARS